jgi:tRNA A37 methylthiotransferase MiaB
MLGQVSHQTKKERAQRLRELSEKKSKEFRNKAIGEEVEVILESLDDSAWMGQSENYLPVVIRTPTGSHGQMLRCRLQSESGGMLVGKSL